MIFWILCWIGSAVAAITDFRKHVIPHYIVIPMAGIAVLAMIFGKLSWWNVAWAAAMWLMWEWLIAVRRREWMAWGDVKLLTAMALFTGMGGFFVMSLGLLLNTGYSRIMRRWHPSDSYAYAPAFFMGFTVFMSAVFLSGR